MIERLPVARIRLEAVVETPLLLPDYAGSTLRGAFGGALRRIACMTRQPECDGCPLLQTCPYAVIFETAPPPEGTLLQKFSEVPRPYVIEPPAWGSRRWQAGEPFQFHLVLIGRALHSLPLIMLAWQQALARGIGAGDGRARLLRAIWESPGGDVQVFDGATGRAEPVIHQPALIGCSKTRSVSLEFFSPLRLQQNGHALGSDRLTARTLIAALCRRASLLETFHGAGAPAYDFSALLSAAESLQENRDLEWRDWTRRSSRQQRAMQFGGLLGTWHLAGSEATMSNLLPYLYVGQWLHVGKEATFGMGGYRLQQEP